MHVNLRFNSFEVESSIECQTDSLHIESMNRCIVAMSRSSIDQSMMRSQIRESQIRRSSFPLGGTFRMGRHGGRSVEDSRIFSRSEVWRSSHAEQARRRPPEHAAVPVGDKHPRQHPDRNRQPRSSEVTGRAEPVGQRVQRVCAQFVQLRNRGARSRPCRTARRTSRCDIRAPGRV